MVGGGSPGQAAVDLSRFARSVTILVRRPELAETMSSYLIGEIEYNSRISARTCTAVVDGGGDGASSGSASRTSGPGSGQPSLRPACSCCSARSPTATGSRQPSSRDARGFVLTGRDVPRDRWEDGVPPENLATTVPGIFAAGDVRSGSMKRVAAASGEGASVVPLVHLFLSPYAGLTCPRAATRRLREQSVTLPARGTAACLT